MAHKTQGPPVGDNPSIVYFAATVLPGGRTIVKIGTTIRLAQRLTDIAKIDPAARGQRPVVLHIEAGSYEREHERHEQFWQYHVVDEWFTDEVLADPSVTTLGTPHAYAAAHPLIIPCLTGWGGVNNKPLETQLQWIADHGQRQQRRVDKLHGLLDITDTAVKAVLR